MCFLLPIDKAADLRRGITHGQISARGGVLRAHAVNGLIPLASGERI
jgi:hypothetical protein